LIASIAVTKSYGEIRQIFKPEQAKREDAKTRITLRRERERETATRGRGREETYQGRVPAAPFL